ncbi:MAG: hypothetical protein Q7S11_00020 [bacterium]|nr:hypothetical protein [bacterium]
MKKQTIVIALAILVLIGLGWVVVYKNTHAKKVSGLDWRNSAEWFPVKTDKATTTTVPKKLDTSTWKKYKNTSFRYSVKYPKDAEISTIVDLDPTPVEKGSDIQIFVPGSNTDITVNVLVPLIHVSSETIIKRNKLLALSLRELSEKVRLYEVNYKNPNFKNREVGSMKEITIDGQKAYSFTLSAGFDFEWTGGYILPDNTIYNYIFVENKNGEKMMIHYPLKDEVSGAMMSSFAFLGE